MASTTGIYTPFFSLKLTRDAARSAEGEELPVQPLFIGQKVAAGSASNGTIHEVVKLADVEELAGKGSHIYAVMASYFKRRSTTRAFIGVLDDAGGATKGSRDFTVAGAPTENGTLYFRLNGEKFGIPVVTTDDVTAIAAKIVAEVGVSATTGRRVTATNVAGVVTFEASNGGAGVGTIELGYNTDATDEPVPGLTITVGAQTAGTGDPDIDDVIANIGDAHFYQWLSPYADSVSIGKAEAALDILGDQYNARDGIYVTFDSDTVSNLKALAAGSASKYTAIVDVYGWQSDRYSIAGVLGREVAISVKADVNLPLHNLVLPDLVGPSSGNERVWEDRNSLAQDGVAGLDPDKLTLESPVTTWTEFSEERRWENIYNLSSLRISFKNRILTRYPRAKLKKGDETVDVDQQLMTPTIGRAEAISWYSEKILRAQVEDLQYFVDNLTVEVTDVDTITWQLPCTLVGQFVVGTGDLNYILTGSN